MNRHDLRKYMMMHFTMLIVAVWTASSYAFTVTDDEQQSIHFEKPFRRIISLYPAHTENLAYLGCDEQIIGISTSDTFPVEILTKPTFSYRDNAEKFLAARPDLILIRPMISRSQPELMDKLRASGITIASLQPTSVNSMLSYWKALGMLTGKITAAEKMVNRFQKTVETLTAALPDDRTLWPVVYFESIHSKMKTFAPDSISAFTLSLGGGINVASDAVGRNSSNIAPYGKERLLSHADAIDVFLSQVGRMNRITTDEIYREPGFQLIKAVQNNAVYLIDEEVVSRPTMRLLEGAGQIHSILYKRSALDEQSTQITSLLPHPTN